MLDARTALPSAEGLPNIPTEVRDSLKSYGYLCGDVVAATLDKDATPLEVADLIAARNRIEDELIVSIARWKDRQVKLSLSLVMETAYEADHHNRECLSSLAYVRNGPAANSAQQAIYSTGIIIESCKAAIGGAL